MLSITFVGRRAISRLNGPLSRPRGTHRRHSFGLGRAGKRGAVVGDV